MSRTATAASGSKSHFPMSFKVIASGVILTIAWIFWPFITGEASLPQDERAERLILFVTFEPTPRTNKPVSIVVSVEMKELVNESVKESPWTKVIQIPRGAKVMLAASSQQGTLLICSIGTYGEIAYIDRQKRTDPGSVRCRHNYPKPA